MEPDSRGNDRVNEPIHARKTQFFEHSRRFLGAGAYVAMDKLVRRLKHFRHWRKVKCIPRNASEI
jgi:hypothetical protein